MANTATGTLSVVEQYWTGVLARLQAEINTFNKLIGHAGEQGRENELSLVRLLSSLLPQRYGLGSGLVIDSEGSESKQTDILVFDSTDEPSVLAQTNQVLFPVENVLACIEVKTTVDTKEIRDIGKKNKSIRSLKPKGDVALPARFVLAYGSRLLAPTLVENVLKLDAEDRPDAFCVLNLGMLGGRPEVLGVNPDTASSYIIGLTELHDNGEGEGRTARKYVSPAADYIKPVHRTSGNSYPIVQYENSSYVVEPSRALLLFCETLVGNLERVRGTEKVPSMSYYVTDLAREVTNLAQVAEVQTV